MNVKHESGLVWSDQRGVGYYPVVQNGQYDEAYWENYQKYRNSPIAEALMDARVSLVSTHAPGQPVVDIGIGSGHFIETRKGVTYGYDVNPTAIRWLLDRDLWWDPYARDPEHVTCWDTLEHMSRPDAFVERVRKTLVVSVPVFVDLAHVVASKHFKPNEHYFYWTRDGLVSWLRAMNFELVAENEMETELGREGIGTFVFKRIAPEPSDALA